MLQTEVICQDHQQKLEYYSPEKSQFNKFFCQECISQTNKKVYIKIDELRQSIEQEITDVIYYGQEQLKKKQIVYERQLTIIEKQLQLIVERLQTVQNILNNINQNNFDSDLEYSMSGIIDSCGDQCSKIHLNKIIDQQSFSQTLINSNIERININVVRQKQRVSNSLALFEPILASYEETVLYLKINKLNKSVAIGVCDEDTVKKKQFILDKWDSLGHGCYMLSSGGYTYNSHFIEHNFKKQGFNYCQNNILKITYNPIEKIIKFQQINDSSKIFQMPIELNNVYACVYLSKVGDEIEFLQI